MLTQCPFVTVTDVVNALEHTTVKGGVVVFTVP